MARQTQEGHRFREELLDELLGGADPAQVFSDGGLIDDLKKALAERALDAEMDAHLDREPERSSGNHRNGHNRKRAHGFRIHIRTSAAGDGQVYVLIRVEYDRDVKPATLVAMPADGLALRVPFPEDIKGVYQLIEHEGSALVRALCDPASKLALQPPSTPDSRQDTDDVRHR